VLQEMRKHVKISKSAILAALLITGCYILGIVAKNKLIETSRVSLSKSRVIITFFLVSIILTIIFSILFSLLYEKTQNEVSIEQSDTFLDFHSKKMFLSIFALMLLCWIPLLIMFFPGNFDIDTYWELPQIYGLSALGNHHPFFDTLLFGLFWKIGDLLGSNAYSLLLYAIFQYILTASALTIAVVYVYQHSNNVWIPRIMWIFFALYPVIPQFSMSIAKDALHDWIFVLYFIFYLEILRTQGKSLIQLRFVIFMILISFFCAITKKTGIYIILVSDLFLFLSLKQGRKRLLAIILALILLNNGLWNQVILRSFHVAPGSEREKYSVPSQQVALYLKRHDNEMSTTDWQTLRRVFNTPEKLSESYLPICADYTKAYWKETTTRAGKIQFFNWYIKTAYNHPKTFVLAQAALNEPLLCIDNRIGRSGTRLYYEGVGRQSGKIQEKNALFSTYPNTTVNDIHTIFRSAYRNNTHENLYVLYYNNYLKITQYMKPLFSKVLYTTWIPIFFLCYGFFCRKKNIVISIVPSLLNLGILAVGPVVFSRYAILSVYLTPIIFALPWIDGIGTMN
jgi:hypothetical protein